MSEREWRRVSSLRLVRTWLLLRRTTKRSVAFSIPLKIIWTVWIDGIKISILNRLGSTLWKAKTKKEGRSTRKKRSI